MERNGGRLVANRSKNVFRKRNVRSNLVRSSLCSWQSKGQRPLPPDSHRTLHHPSFMSLYTSPGLRQRHGEKQTVHPMIPQEFFYTDPTMICGTRIANNVTELKDFDCYQVNTPPPIMSASPAPPPHPDPFRAGQHPTRNLGSASWEISPDLSSVNSMCVVIQLTQEEDQAITNLLTLHQGQGRFPAQLGNSPREADSGTLEKHWSDRELEAAHTLFTQFSSTEEIQSCRFSTCSNLSLSGKKQNLTCFTGLPSHIKVLSKSEEAAVHGLLRLGLTQKVDFQQ